MRTAAKSRVGLAVAVLLCAPAAAQAAYAPALQVAVDPATPDAAAALTTTVTQAPGEDATKTAKVSFPAGFGPNLAATIGSCPAAQEEARACPEESRLGAAEARTTLATLSGPVHLSTEGGVLRLLVFLDGAGGLVKQKLVGVVSLRPDQGFDTTFDDLPNLATSSFVLRLEGGGRALLRTPRVCGRYVFAGAFTSHQGTQVTSEAPVEITGCATTPSISRAALSARRFRAVRESADRRRRGYGATLTWELSEATNGTRVVVERRAGRRWRRVGSLLGTGNAGANELRFDGRLDGRPLRPGRYRLALRTTNAAGRASRARRIEFEIVR